MKILINNYTFNASSKTVTFTDYSSITLDNIYAVINVTQNIIIYNPTISSLGGTVSTNVLTLTYNTASMSNSDKLMIIYNGNDRISSANTPAISNSSTAALANGSRKSITVTNCGTNILYVLYGNGASGSVYHVALKGCATNDDATGGTVYNDEYTGIVTIAGTSPRYTILEM